MVGYCQLVRQQPILVRIRITVLCSCHFHYYVPRKHCFNAHVFLPLIILSHLQKLAFYFSFLYFFSCFHRISIRLIWNVLDDLAFEDVYIFMNSQKKKTNRLFFSFFFFFSLYSQFIFRNFSSSKFREKYNFIKTN